MMEPTEEIIQLQGGDVVEHRYRLVFDRDLGRMSVSEDIPLVQSGDTRVAVLPPYIDGNSIVMRMFVARAQSAPDDVVAIVQ